MDGDGVMVVVNDTNFGEKGRFRKLAVGNKKGTDAEGRERRGGEGDSPYMGGGGGGDGIAMDADLYQRDVL